MVVTNCATLDAFRTAKKPKATDAAARRATALQKGAPTILGVAQLASSNGTSGGLYTKGGSIGKTTHIRQQKGTFFILVQNAPVSGCHPSSDTARMPRTMCLYNAAAVTCFTKDQRAAGWDAAGEGLRGPTRNKMTKIPREYASLVIVNTEAPSLGANLGTTSRNNVSCVRTVPWGADARRTEDITSQTSGRSEDSTRAVSTRPATKRSKSAVNSSQPAGRPGGERPNPRLDGD